MIRESLDKRLITAIEIFDFDGTLAVSPTPEVGKIEYRNKTGQDWPHSGWWGREESLDTNIFDIPIIKSVVSEYNKIKNDGSILKVMMTGRPKKLSAQIESILSDNGIYFDDYVYNTGGATLDYKINKLDHYVTWYPNLKRMKIFEDRVEHAEEFVKWGEKQDGIEVDVHFVK